MDVDVDYREVSALRVDLGNAPAEARRKVSQAVRRTAFAIEADAKVGAPIDTGDLANSISTDVGAGGLSAEIGPTVHYGAHVEYGTAPHVIRPRDGGKLVFVVGGRLVFADKVNHPGTTPQPYMGPAFDRQTPGFERAVGDAGADIL